MGIKIRTEKWELFVYLLLLCEQRRQMVADGNWKCTSVCKCCIKNKITAKVEYVAFSLEVKKKHYNWEWEERNVARCKIEQLSSVEAKPNIC